MIIGVLLFSVFTVIGLQASTSSDAWAFGTQAYETVPFLELDPEYAATLQVQPGLGAVRHQIRADGGCTDWLEAGLAIDAGAGPLQGSGSLKARLLQQGSLFVDLAPLAEGAYDEHGHWQGGLGLVMAKPLGDHEFAGNLLWAGSEGFLARVAYRSGYFFWATRAGLEAQTRLQGSGAEDISLGPQVLVNLPGDITIRLAAWKQGWQGQAWSARAALGFELFPNP
jgi:hypothetical protein